MKKLNITLTGSLGNIGKPLAEKLIAAGHHVTVISSNSDKRAAIEALGASAAIGSVTDVHFLNETFAGTDALFTMVPPNFAATNMRAYIAGTGKLYAEAIRQSGIKQVVHLSSMGAHLQHGAGPINGQYDVEQLFNQLENVAVTFLRPPFFYVNYYGNIDMIRHAGILGANCPGDTKMFLVHPADIAVAAAGALQQESSGKNIHYIVSDERTNTEIATVLGTAIGKPDLPWVTFSDEEAKKGMLQSGLPEEVAAMFVTMGNAARSGKIWEQYVAERTGSIGTIKLETFANEFAERYNNA